MSHHLIIGMGEIGSAIYGLFPTAITLDAKDEETALIDAVSVMHICFPYSEEFIDYVLDYMEEYRPNHVIIYSTVPIGTTKQILNAVHSPVEGKHPDLELSIRQMVRWIGYNGMSEEGIFFKNLFWEKGINSRIVESTDFTEFLKLRSTSKYGINIAWTAYEKKVADGIEMPFELLKEFDRDYNKLYKNMGIDWAQRYILDPPDGPIGGHCVVPNAKLLNKQFPSGLLDEIIVTGELDDF